MQGKLFNLEEYQIEDTEDNIEHMVVLLQAAEIYNDRSRIRGQHWKGATLEKHLENIDQKVGRLRMIKQMGRSPMPEDVDEAIDIINYGNFCVRHLRGLIDENQD